MFIISRQAFLSTHTNGLEQRVALQMYCIHPARQDRDVARKSGRLGTPRRNTTTRAEVVVNLQTLCFHFVYTAAHPSWYL
jgi:hypothetical protein